jgi:hypothetical protein
VILVQIGNHTQQQTFTRAGWAGDSDTLAGGKAKVEWSAGQAGQPFDLKQHRAQAASRMKAARPVTDKHLAGAANFWNIVVRHRALELAVGWT